MSRPIPNIDLNGVIIIDKAADMTSAQVVSVVKKTLKVKKVGHTGTLDPFATGVLICCINRATKLSKFFLSGNKKYDAMLHLGIETDTQDATGKITATSDPVNFSEGEIRDACKKFEGAGMQLPPVFSALKHNGRPLYKLARKGQPVQKPARPIVIHYIKIGRIDLPFVHFEVSCSSGTYIRTLCADIGRALGCGGHLKELKRIESSGLTLNEAFSLEELKKAVFSGQISDKIISMRRAVQYLPELAADTALMEKIIHDT
ncbi:MAG: tRNA pseudouridine(55) synthase TruB [Desulfobacterales bacterium]|nr:tRNA pseudouridine(55) synthase TruB [Desulfobacterales bacterium]